MSCGKASNHLKGMSELPTSHVPNIKRPSLMDQLFHTAQEDWYKQALDQYEEQKAIYASRQQRYNSPEMQGLNFEIERQPDDVAKGYIEDTITSYKIPEQCEALMAFMLFCKERPYDLLMQLWDFKDPESPIANHSTFDRAFLKRAYDILEKDFGAIYSEHQKGRVIYAMIARLRAVVGNTTLKLDYLYDLSATVFSYIQKHPESDFAVLVSEYIIHNRGDQELLKRIRWRYKYESVGMINKVKKKLSKEDQAQIKETADAIFDIKKAGYSHWNDGY